MWAIDYTLPLQLCGISVILSIIVLLNKSYSFFEVLYFWGLGGALQAVLTPEIGYFTYPHFRYFQFFLSHGIIIITCIYMVLVEGYKPRIKSVWKAFIGLNIYAGLIAIFNYLTNSNYLFICRKPEVTSLMSYLGPWPWYIASLEVVALIIFFLLYSPFAIKGSIQKPRPNAHYLNY